MSEINSLAVGITEEMIELAAEQIYGGPHIRFKLDEDGAPVEYTCAWSEVVDVLGFDERDAYLRKARRILEAALAGRTPLELPQSTGKWSDGVPYWDAENRVVAAQVDESGRPYTRLNGQIWLVTEAEAVGLALVAAAREARRLASGSSESGEPQAGDGS